MMEVIRVFPRRTSFTPIGPLAFVGEPGLFRPTDRPVHISVAFTWDIPEAERLYRSWSRFYTDVQLGGPAFGDPGGDFTPGFYTKHGITITSRGCPNTCGFCLVPKREGYLRELPIKDGWNVADNNLLACSQTHVELVFNMLRRQPEPIKFSGGLDARLLQSWHVDLLKTIRIERMMFACDSWAGIEPLERCADLLGDFSSRKKGCFVLVGFGGESMRVAENRLKKVVELGFEPQAMFYRDEMAMHRKDSKWGSFVRTWSRPAVYKSMLRNSGKVEPSE